MRSRSKSRSLSFGLSSLLFSLDCGTERTKIEFPLSKTGNPVWLPPEDHRRDDSVLSLLLLFNEDPLEWASGLRGPDWDWDWVALAAAPSCRLSLSDDDDDDERDYDDDTNEERARVTSLG